MFRRVEAGVRTVEQARSRVVGCAHGDADARPEAHVDPIRCRVVQGAADAPCEVLCVGGIVERIDDHDELVAAHPRRGVGRADEACDAGCDVDEETVAGGMPVGVVDGLEAIEVDEAQTDPVPTVAAARQGLREVTVEESPVGKTGELVVVGLSGELLRELFAFGGVA